MKWNTLSKTEITVDPTLAVLTRAGTRFGLDLLQALHQAGKRPALLIVEETPLSKRWKMMKRLAKRIGWKDALSYNIRFWWPHLIRLATGGRLYPLPNYTPYAQTVIWSRDINAPSCVEALKRLNIRTVLLGQSGIVKKPILSVNGLWIVNAHPGKVPEFRGVDVIRWALYQQHPVYVTLHQIDSGIDTGPVLEEVRIPVLESDEISDIEQKALEKSIRLLVQASQKGLKGYPVTPQPPLHKRELFTLMPKKTVAKLSRQWPKIREKLVRTTALMEIDESKGFLPLEEPLPR